MRLRQIEIFYHVYKCGSISEAARELNVSQPSVSKVLRYAEDQLGFALFRREKGRLFPTSAADELFGDIKEIYQKIEAFDRTATNIRNRKGGHIRLGVLPSLSLDIVPECITELQKTQPELGFEISTLHSHEFKNAVIENRVDLCLGYDFTGNDRMDVQTLGHGQLMVISTQSLQSDHRGTVEPDMLQGQNFIGLKDSGPLAKLLFNALDSRNITPNTLVTAHTYHVALSLVRKGLGVTVTDQFTAQSYAAQDLNVYPFSIPLSFDICSVRQSDHPQKELIDGFVDVVRDFVSPRN